MLSLRAPGSFGSVAPKDDGWDAQRGGEMGDAGVVTDEEGALTEAGSEFREGERTGEFARGGIGEPFETSFLRFAADEE